MSSQYTSTYRTAMEAAKVELDALLEDARHLRNRMEQIDSVIIALKPLAGESPDGGFTSAKQQIDAVLAFA